MTRRSPRSPRRAISSWAAATVAFAACAHPHASESVTARAGLSIAVYTGADATYAVFDDRRTVELVGGELALDQVEAGASLASVVIEPLGGDDLVVGVCRRDAVVVPPAPPAPVTAGSAAEAAARAALEPKVTATRPFRVHRRDVPELVTTTLPTIHCAARGRAGRHRVRVLYAHSGLDFVAQTDVTVDRPGRATIASRYLVQTPRRGGAVAAITLFAGLPGTGAAPVAVARGTAALDGSTAVFAPPPRDVPARLRYLLEIAATEDDYAPRDEYGIDEYGIDGSKARRGVASDHEGEPIVAARPAQVVLDLEADLPAGLVYAHVALPGEDPHDLVVVGNTIAHHGHTSRAALWVDPMVRITLEHRVLRHANRKARERTRITVANLGPTSRDVYIDQTLPPRSDRMIETSWPAPPTLVRDAVRTKLAVAPAAVVRTRYIIATPADDDESDDDE